MKLTLNMDKHDTSKMNMDKHDTSQNLTLKAKG